MPLVGSPTHDGHPSGLEIFFSGFVHFPPRLISDCVPTPTLSSSAVLSFSAEHAALFWDIYGFRALCRFSEGPSSDGRKALRASPNQISAGNGRGRILGCRLRQDNTGYSGIFRDILGYLGPYVFSEGPSSDGRKALRASTNQISAGVPESCEMTV